MYLCFKAPFTSFQLHMASWVGPRNKTQVHVNGTHIIITHIVCIRMLGVEGDNDTKHVDVRLHQHQNTHHIRCIFIVPYKLSGGTGMLVGYLWLASLL